jgi:hypothetical protein
MNNGEEAERKVKTIVRDIDLVKEDSRATV